MINISHNKVDSLEPICGLRELRVLIAADNIILSLHSLNQVQKLAKLDCSRNAL